MAQARSDSVAWLLKRWNLPFKHALYRKTGDWYHQLTNFPGALLDEHGYVVFETEAACRDCPQLRIGQDVGVPSGIREIPGYTLFGAHESPPTSYEKVLEREGARVEARQVRAERNPQLRSACLAEHGRACCVCGFDFGRRYESIGEGFIHVHHVTPLAEGERLVDPITDLRPLCPNCHAMAHRREPPLTIEELKGALRGAWQVAAGGRDISVVWSAQSRSRSCRKWRRTLAGAVRRLWGGKSTRAQNGGAGLVAGKRTAGGIERKGATARRRKVHFFPWRLCALAPLR